MENDILTFKNDIKKAKFRTDKAENEKFELDLIISRVQQNASEVTLY